MKLKELRRRILDLTYTVFVELPDDMEIIEMKPYKTDGYDWIGEQMKMSAYSDCEVSYVMYNPRLGQIAIHVTADGRKEIGA